MKKSLKSKRFLTKETETGLQNTKSDGKGTIRRTTHGNLQVTSIVQTRSKNLKNETRQNKDEEGLALNNDLGTAYRSTTRGQQQDLECWRFQGLQVDKPGTGLSQSSAKEW